MAVFAGEVESKLRRQEVYKDVDIFIQKIGILLHAKKDEGLHLLKSMVSLVKAKRDAESSSRGQRQHRDWLNKCAKALDVYQLIDRDWIESHIHPLPARKTSKVQVYEPKKGQKDIRLKDNPQFPVLHFVETNKPEEDALLAPTPGMEEMDFDLSSDPDISLGSPSPQRPVPATITSTTAASSTPDSSQVAVCPSTVSSTLTKDVACPSTYTPEPLTVAVCPSTRPTSPTDAVAPMSVCHSRVFRRSSRSTQKRPAKAPERSVERVSKRSRTSAEDLRISFTPSVPAKPQSFSDRLSIDRAQLQNTARMERRRRNATCLVPGCTEGSKQFMKMHAFNCHIPEIFDLRLPANDEVVLKSRVQALRQVSTWLLGRPGNLQELLALVKMQKCSDILAPAGFTAPQIQAMEAVCHHLDLPVPATFSLDPPNHVAVLLHWKILHLLAALLPEDDDRVNWRSMFPQPQDLLLQKEREEEEVPVPVYPEAVDSHFHLDRLQVVTRLSHLPVHESLDGSRVEDSRRVNLVAVVANFCDPDTYPSDRRLADLPPEVIVTVGIHPKHARRSANYVRRAVVDLQRLLRNPRVAAIGEIGLDHSISDKDWPAQNELLRQIVPIISPHHVVVVHCRGITGDDGLEAYCLLRHIFKTLPPTQKFHLHSFMGNQMTITAWLKAFPSTWFSFNRSVQHFDAEQVEALCSLDETKILLETDAPYFKRREDQYSMPNQLYDVAEMVASHRGVDVRRVLDVTKDNALYLYRGQS